MYGVDHENFRPRVDRDKFHPIFMEFGPNVGFVHRKSICYREVV
jgi:hypothetical protein